MTKPYVGTERGSAIVHIKEVGGSNEIVGNATNFTLDTDKDVEELYVYGTEDPITITSRKKHKVTLERLFIDTAVADLFDEGKKFDCWRILQHPEEEDGLIEYVVNAEFSKFGTEGAPKDVIKEKVEATAQRIVRGKGKLKLEETHTFQSGTTEYELNESNPKRIIVVRGTYNGEANYTFNTDSKDYELTADGKIKWLDGGKRPDDNTDFKVTYIYE